MTGALIDFAPLVKAVTVLVTVLVLLSFVVAWGFLMLLLGHWVTTFEPYMMTAGRITLAVGVLLLTVAGLGGGLGMIVWQAVKLK